MQSLDLKPTHKPVRSYYNALKQFEIPVTPSKLLP